MVNSASVYAQPSGSATVVAVAEGGDQLELIDDEGDWCIVRVPSTNVVGHVYAPFVDRGTASLPATTTTTTTTVVTHSSPAGGSMALMPSGPYAGSPTHNATSWSAKADSVAVSAELYDAASATLVASATHKEKSSSMKLIDDSPMRYLDKISQTLVDKLFRSPAVARR